MKKLAIKSVLFLFLIFFSIFTVYVILPESKEALMASLIDKHRLLESTDSPKIVLVGGSNLPFGIDSKLIDENFNYGVVNSALTGGMGLNFMLSFVKPSLKKGDIVVLALEYQILNNKRGSFMALNQALGEYPYALKYVSPFKNQIEPGTIMHTIQRRTLDFLGLSRNSTKNSLSRTGFNEYGDLVQHLDKEPWLVQKKRYKLKYKTPKPEIINVLNNFYRYCHERGIIVYMTFAPFPRPLKSDSGKKGDEWVKDIQRDLLIPIISNPDNYLFPDNYFWGNVYHLNAVGRKERTQILIKDLKAAIKKTHD